MEIDDDLWQLFLKKLVDVYGSAYASKKKEAINEAIKMWLDIKEEQRRGASESEELRKLVEDREISPAVLKLLGKNETMIPVGLESKIVAEVLKARMC